MITKRDKMIGKTNKLQLLPQKILPKKPSITNSANQSTIFDDTFPGEFHTSWEHDLWGVDVIPEDIDLDGLDHFTHGLANEEPQLSSDPMLSEVIEENSLHLNQASQNNTHENETVLLEMIVDNADIPLPQGALVLANSLGNESIEEISQNSVDFNDTSESGFDDSFCGWDPSSMMDSNSYDQEQDNTHEDLLQTALTETFPQQRLHTEQQDFTKSDLYSSQMTESNQKKRVGRPHKTLVHTVASVPVRGSKKLIETMKRRRYVHVYVLAKLC